MKAARNNKYALSGWRRYLKKDLAKLDKFLCGFKNTVEIDLIKKSESRGKFM